MTTTIEQTREQLLLLRLTPRYRISFLVIGIGLGLAVSLLHWVGFLLAGIVIGIGASTLRDAVLLAIGVGLVVVGAFLTYAWWHDQLSIVLDLGELTVLALLIPVGLLLLGSLIRGIT